jgi:hypothetical protein
MYKKTILIIVVFCLFIVCVFVTHAQNSDETVIVYSQNLKDYNICCHLNAIRVHFSKTEVLHRIKAEVANIDSLQKNNKNVDYLDKGVYIRCIALLQSSKVLHFDIDNLNSRLVKWKRRVYNNRNQLLFILKNSDASVGSESEKEYRVLYFVLGDMLRDGAFRLTANGKVINKIKIGFSTQSDNYSSTIYDSFCLLDNTLIWNGRMLEHADFYIPNDIITIDSVNK